MRKLNIFLALAFFFTSCVVDDVQYIENGPINTDGGLKIIGAVQDFDIKRVSTRAGDSDLPSDSFISEMTMFVFDKNNNIVQGYLKRTVNAEDADGNPTDVTFNDIDKCTSAVNIQKANPTFLIDTKAGIIASLDEATPRTIYYDNLDTTGNNDLSECKIYIVANAWHELEARVNNITDLSTLENYIIPIDNTLSMPKKDDTHYRGFPMIGTHADQTFDLSYSGNNAGAVAKIPLKKLYAKINFTIQVNADQVVSTPEFKIEKAEVFNVPTKARLGRALDGSGKPDYSAADDYIVEMVGSAAYTPSEYYQFIDNAPFVITDGFSRKTISHTTSKTPTAEYLIEFGFYMPEHKVTPNANETTYKGYPTGIDPDLKQYYKPMLVGAVRGDDGITTNSKYATFVRIHGKYTDHNGQIKTVRYDVYLGQDNTDDFTVKRNQLLNNKLIITGLTNYHDAYGDNQTNISVDHRVDVEYSGFNLSMERTAILDSHFEVRPLDVELSPGSTMVVTIPEDYRSWVAMESDATAKGGSQDVYINTTDDRKGVRKYFTTYLVSELTKANGGTITLEHSGEDATKTEIHRIWFYIDENPNVYDKLGKGAQSGETGYTVGTDLYRNCPVEFKYTGIDGDNTDGAATVTKTATINFQQWNLWRVWNSGKTRYYDIEHEEEYLNNYASDQQYGGTQDGMEWGLDGIQLSHIHSAISLGKSTGIAGEFNQEDAYTKAFQQLEESPMYDYYLSRDTSDEDLTIHDYVGRDFNEEIIEYLLSNYSSKAAAKLNKVILTEDVKSAISYCYNKNRRDANGDVCTLNTDGTLNSTNLKWYLPAIDEIEEIAIGAYDEFDKVFQNEFYWSCQPAYDPVDVDLTVSWGGLGNFGHSYATYFIDNVNRARSTSVLYIGTDANGNSIYEPSPSGDGGSIGTQYGKVEATIFSGNKVTLGNFVEATASYDNVPGNKLRTDYCRIRAVYRSGTASTTATIE